ncbi:diguanylate cyclase [Rugamonas sp. CCM 8940]|uniref:sensor domain-containing diguanylate cyclase n=1 Tax=Rugamonas sp. CCM 8940 TaxID=2765359 RepID=UPI0018F61CBD|nr:sensor domain-containing diguanylate cyclase [Rugamonas sp. CCM 8940]MBJ7311324.1 GGDEF domain-containing protein [Rugamonas sp. CCM 8940]
MPAAQKIHLLGVARPPADQFRVAALQRYQILDTPPCEDFSFLAELAARLCGMPYAAIALVDAERVWLKASHGLPLGSMPRQDSYCALTVLGEATTEIADLSEDYRTAHLPYTVAAPHMRMYSGVALTSPDGFHIGALCVMDSRPGALDEAQRRTLARLGRQVMALIELRANQRTLGGSLRELEQLALTDELTGLHNRRSLLQRLQFEVARAKRFRTPLSALMIDLDDLKGVNDRYGHAAGDMVLANVGRLLRESVRVIDIAGRYGGEELCVVLPNTPREGARTLAETLRAKLEAQPHTAGAHTLPVTVSIGVGAFDHMGVADAESLLRQADEALRRAKDGGRNRVDG